MLNYCKYNGRLRKTVHSISSTQRENSLEAVDSIGNYLCAVNKPDLIFSKLHSRCVVFYKNKAMTKPALVFVP